MDTWLHVFHGAPVQWTAKAKDLALNYSQEPPRNKAIVIVVFDRDHAKLMRKDYGLEWLPCGKVANLWWYLDAGEVKVHEPKRKRSRADSAVGQRRQREDVPSRSTGKRRPTRPR